MNLKRTLLVGTLIASLTVPTMVFADTVSEDAGSNAFRGQMRSERNFEAPEGMEEMKELMEQLRNGDITKDEFDEQVEALGLSGMGMKGNKDGMKGNRGGQDNLLREATKDYLDGTITEDEYEAIFEENLPEDATIDFDTHLEVLELRQELKDGDITQEEFEEAIADYDLPERPEKAEGKGGMNNPLREATKDYLDGTISEDEYEAIFEENLPEDATIDFDTHLEVLELREQLKDGDITQEEFEEAIADYDLPERPERSERPTKGADDSEGFGVRSDMQQGGMNRGGMKGFMNR